jgi:prophage regulatory protein
MTHPEASKPTQALPDLSTLPDDALIRERTLVPGYLPVARSTLWRWVRNGTCPQPVRLGPNTVAWRVGDIRHLLAGVK